MVDYKPFYVFDIVSTTVEIDPHQQAVEVGCLDSKGTAVQLRMSRSDLERLLLLATRELERVPLPVRDPSSR